MCIRDRLTAKRQSGPESQGFTLVELIVVRVIMGILTAAILPMVTGYVATAKEKVEESNLHMVEQAARLYLTRWEMENGDADSTTITASELEMCIRDRSMQSTNKKIKITHEGAYFYEQQKNNHNRINNRICCRYYLSLIHIWMNSM